MNDDYTSAGIAISNDEGGYHCIYCAHGGDTLGATLKRHHNSRDKALALVSLGDLERVTVRRAEARHRDGGEPWYDCKPREVKGARALFRWARFHATPEYLYVFLPSSSGRWRWRTFDCASYHLFSGDDDEAEFVDADEDYAELELRK